MRARAKSFVALVSLLACSACAFALDPSLDISQYAHTAWRIRDGFVKGDIISIAQTPDGYLWLGTLFGLVRFDGVRAVPWQPPDNQPLPPGTIRTLLAARNGTLWIGTWTGLASWRDGKLTRYPKLDGLMIFALLEDRDGTIWAGAGGTPNAGKLCAIRGSSVDCFGGDGRLGPAVVALLEDRDGNLWVGVKDGLWRWKPGPPKFYSLAGESDGIKAIAEDADGALLVGWKGGISRFVNGKMQPYPLSGLTSRFRARRILRDRNGSLWIGTVESGLVHIHRGRADVFSEADGLSGDFTTPQFEDSEGDIWVTTVEGLDRFRDLAVMTLTKKQGLSRALVGSILSDKDGNVWLGTSGGLNRWDHGRISTPSTGGAQLNGKLDRSSPNSLLLDGSGRIWISTTQELGYLENGRFTSIRGVPPGNILSIV
jgi:ligand-binding sensor domain-containing protein